MGSVLRAVSRRKKRRRIGPPQVIRQEDYQGQDDIIMVDIIEQGYIGFEMLPLLGIRALVEKSGC